MRGLSCRRLTRLVSLGCLVGVACAPPAQSREARTSYNAGLSMVGDGEFEDGIALLSKARSNSAGDPDVRFRAAFALGQSYVQWAATAGEDEASVAIERYERAEAWFQDAIRLREDDEGGRHNLALAIARRRKLVDAMTAGGRTLDARLAAVLKDQRGVRDEMRLEEANLASGTSAPEAQGEMLKLLATRERGLAADVGVVSDLAAAERGEIEAVPEADRSPEQAGRFAQLAALVHYLDRARTSIADTRAAARKDGVRRAVRRAEASVAELVRAREQLLGPAAVLQGFAVEQNQLFKQTSALAALSSGDIELQDQKAEPPPFMSTERLGERERHLHERASELDARLAAFLREPPADPTAAEANAQAEQEAKAVFEKAAPLVASAVASMKTATEELASDDAALAANAMANALMNLALALEYFSGLRQLIEIAYADQTSALALLDPESGAKTDTLSTEERIRKVQGISSKQLERVERLVGLLAEEKAKQLAQLEQQAAGGDPAEAKASIEAMFAKADGHRAAVLEAVVAMEAAIQTRGGDALAPAKKAHTELEELRRLFFSVIEHLKDLHRRQGATRDGLSAATASPDDERPALLGPLVASQSEHAAFSAQIGDALAAQADQAGASAGQPGAPDPEKLVAAADEVRQATTLMEAASRKLTDAEENLKTMSVNLEPPLEDQKSAIERLATAIELLSPPKKDQKPPPKDEPKENKDENKDEPKDDENKEGGEPSGEEDQPEGDMSQSELEDRLRSIREDETKNRQKKKQAPRTGGNQKDW